MRLRQVNLAAILSLTTALVISGCKSSNPTPPANEPSAQTAPAAPPAAAPATEPASAPAAASTTPAAAPALATAPAVATSPAGAAAPAAAPAPRTVKLTAPAGTAISVTINQQLSAKNNNVGDTFSGELAAPVTTAGGATVFPRGAHVTGTVVAAKGRGRFKGEGDLAIQATEIAGHRVTTSPYVRQEKGKGKRSAGLIGGGAGGGALIGGLAGGGKGALLGGLVGAGAGTAGAALTGNKDIVIPAESVVTFRLQAPVTVTR